MRTFIRPLFTCGAFHREAASALMYNTALGRCYRFEGPSATLVGEILSGEREQPVDIVRIAEVTGADAAVVEQFLREELMPVGLVHDHVFSDEEWHRQRAACPPDAAAVGYSPERGYLETLPPEHRVSLFFELTYVCSERCLHCYNEGAARSDLAEERRRLPGLLNLDDYRSIIDEAVELGIPVVTLSGGDPFSYPGCWELLDYLHRKNLAVNLMTNALALDTPELIRRTARLGLRQFCVSVYSAEAGVHDSITRRPGSWERSVGALRAMAQWPVPLNVKTPVFSLNTRTHYGVRRLCQELQAENELSCGLLAGSDGDISILEHLQPSPEARHIMLTDPLQKTAVNKEGHPDGYTSDDSLCGMPCSASRMLCCSPVGRASGCSGLRLNFGDLRRDTLKSVLSSPTRLSLLHSKRQTLLPECGTHDYCRYCTSACMSGRRVEMQSDGTPVFPDPNPDICTVARVRMELSLEIAKGRDPLGGRSVEECLSALPGEPVPVFRKKICPC